MTYMRLFTALFSASAALALTAQTPPQPPAAPQPAPPQQQSAISTRITASPGMQPRLAIPDFIALSPDAETAAAAKTIARVLWDDLQFEREFYLIARDTYQTIPQPPSLEQVPLDRWKELGADGVVVGSVRKTASGVAVQVRLLDVATGTSVLAKEYTGSIANPRLYAHTVSDEIHLTQAALKGVARTKLAFSSDRDGERTTKSGSPRDISNIYTADYDGANERRLTITRALDIAPVWSPDRTAIAYMSYRTGYPDIIVHPMAGGRYTTPARGTAEARNYLPAWSPDGTRLAFMSSRDGDP
jgi:TolB protein